MSREDLGDAPPDALVDERAGSAGAPVATALLAPVELERPASAADVDGPPDVDRPAGDLDLDLGDDGDHGPPDAPAPVATASRPGRPRIVTAAAVVGLLVVGALAGATSVRQQGQAQLDAAARVVVAVHVDQQGFFGAGAGNQSGDVLQFVEVSMIGSLGGAEQVKVEKVRTPVGTFDVYAPVTTGDGEAAERTLLKGIVDCDRANALEITDTLTGHLLEGSTAVVRPVGSSVDVEVPVVVPNPDATLVTFDERCNPQNYGDVDAPAYSVGALVAHADGTLDFVASPGTAVPLRSTPARLAVVTFSGGDSSAPFAELRSTAQVGDSSTFAVPNTRWSVTVSPRLPAVVDRPTLFRVRFTYFCRRGRTTLPTALPPLPEISLGTISSTGGINPYLDGWDGSISSSAMTAAAVNACAPPT